MKLKKMLSVMAAVAVAAVPLAGCGSATPKNKDPYDIPQDYCRTYYEVFVRSFSDGNGDGIGDLRGLINNLDYLNDGDDSTTTDLGVNGIWLMPIHPSPSYHGYDVTDYKAINPKYGTLDDFDELVRECDKRGIWVQIDLVLNHTSIEHEWFRAALSAARDGEDPETNEAMQRYVFCRDEDKPAKGQWHSVSRTDGLNYLGNFSSGMPDLNLDNESVRDGIKDAVDFWLDRGVKSFRLDAVPWAYANDNSQYTTDKNFEFWTWFNDYCNSKGAEVATAKGWANDDIGRYGYNVGEIWSSKDTVASFYGTGMSNFNYSFGANPDNGFAGAANQWLNACKLTKDLQTMQETVLGKDAHALLSNFLSNHDNDRSAGYLSYSAKKIKRAAGLYLLAPGNPYIYYGEEIGAAGSGRDENKRLSFNWGDEKKGIAKSPSAADYKGDQKLGTWKSQTKDADSVLTYYRNAIRLRNRFPEIGRGKMIACGVDASGKIDTQDNIGGELAAVNELNATVAVYTLAWGDRKVLIVQNVGDKEIALDTSAFGGYGLVGQLKADGGSVKLSGNTLKMSGSTVAVLKAA